MLTPAYTRLLCNAIIQPYFNYECFSWFPIFKKNLKLKLQKNQNKWIRFSLNLPPRSHIDPSHFGKINWLPAVAKQNTVLRLPFLRTGMELYQDIFMKCFSLHCAGIVQDHRRHWTYLCGKKIQGTKVYSSQGQKYGPKQALVSKMLEHCLLLCMLLRKIFYFICKANSSYYHILMIDIII